jgi:ankyrin repeat protein
MPTKALPRHPSLEYYKKQAKDLLKRHQAGDPETLNRLQQFHPRFGEEPKPEAPKLRVTLTHAQLVLAREHGFPSWPKFAARIEAIRREHSALLLADPAAAFIEAACVQFDDHQTGTLEAAQAILAKHPEVATSSIYTAASLGDVATVKQYLANDPSAATTKGGLHNWDALTYLCFSRYLRIHGRLDPVRSEGFVAAATALLDAGASPNTGWWEAEHLPHPTWESVIYGAAGMAHHPELTRLLLDRGADPNDDETPYHTPETYDNTVVKIMIESGKLNEDSLTTMLVRKADWHDLEGIRYLLEHGADPNRGTIWKHTPLQHAIRRDNRLAIIEAMLDHGADFNLANGLTGRSGSAMAARRGRKDILEALERRGIPIQLAGVDQLIAACAGASREEAKIIVRTNPELLSELLAEGGTLLTEFAGNGNTEGVGLLLDLGVDVAAAHKEGDNYFNLAKKSTALHAAAWRMQEAPLRLLIERNAPVNARDARGRTPLTLAIRACIDSYWTERRSPDTVAMLLNAGAQPSPNDYPSGYDEVDKLLLQYAKTPKPLIQSKSAATA